MMPIGMPRGPYVPVSQRRHWLIKWFTALSVGQRVDLVLGLVITSILIAALLMVPG